ncbi:glycosyltransferase involved in cell wall biosynthesis [Rhizomicrobium palustre]|uniref:Glycosyltransferase involved in cell wall biosynthesis n=1 Tax=Rhizomicrobium palustre TaxID=189966 RepID=A0A846MU18_9PROT|nr:glycosyltransferase family 4 protein [Rhizomicrobium palustre]NIK86729.1 glycosyltransferase involved in cell wall biosynthesis [Rhizomicrobium palustre]
MLLHVFPSFVVGGSQMRFAALANRFGRAFRHVVISMDGRTDCRERLAPGLDVSFPVLGFRRRDTLGNIRLFRKLLSELKPQRLITYNWGSIECAIANWPGLAPHIHIEDGFGPEEAQGQLRRRVLTRRYVLARSTVVLPSQTLFRLARDVWRLPRLRYVPNGVDCRRFGAPSIKPLAIPGDGPLIGTVAVLRPEKNLSRLIEAVRLVRQKRPCRLVIAGDGPERAKLEREAAPLGEEVSFLGQTSETDRVYAALSVLALSSDTEQMPTAVLEAMAAGLPIAATDVGDVREMVCADNRAFIVPKSAEALAGALEALLSDSEQAKSIGAMNKVMAASRYDQEQMFEAYEALFCGTKVMEPVA